MSSILDRAFSLLGSLALATTLGCDMAAPRSVVERLLPEPFEVLSADAVLGEEVAFEVDFAEAADREGWDIVAAERGRFGNPRGLFVKDEAPLRLEREIALEARDVGEIELRGDPGHRHHMSFWFARCGEDLDPRRRVAFQPVLGTRPALFRAPVATHGAWSGSICRIGVSIEVSPGVLFRLLGLRAVRRSFDPDLARALGERAHKVTLAGVTHTARVVAGSGDFERRVCVPERAVLEGAFGTRSSGRARFSVEADDSKEPLFEEVLPASEARSWHSFRLDLPRRGGEALDLRFRVEVEDAESLSFWGDLRVIGRRDPPRRPDVLLVVIDTLRADRLSLYGHDRLTSPHLDVWARDHAVVFEKTVAAAPWTIPSHASLFTGLDALRHGRHSEAPAPRPLLPWAEILQRAGYETFGVTDGGYLAADFGFAQGFDRWDVRSSLEKVGLPERVDLVARWLLEPTERPPRFAFLHTYDVHAPYRARSPYFERFVGPGVDPSFLGSLRSVRGDDGVIAGAVVRRSLRILGADAEARSLEAEEVRLVGAAYDSEIAAVDEALSRLLDRTASASRPLLIVITSDHGEALGEHGLGDHADLYDHSLLVPLVIAFPDGLGAGPSIRRQVRLVDVLPTVLEALGLDAPPGLNGRSLVDLVRDPESSFPPDAWSATAKQGLSVRVDDRLKVIFNSTLRRRDVVTSAAFDLVADPDESSPLLAEASREALRWLERAHARHRARLRGVQVQIENPTEESLQVEIQTDASLVLDQVQSPDPHPPKVLRHALGSILLEQGPRTSHVVFLEGVLPRHGLRWSSSRSEAVCAVGHGGLEIRAGVSLRLDEACHPVSGAADRRPTVAIRFPRTESLSGPAPAQDVVHRLEGLGYL